MFILKILLSSFLFAVVLGLFGFSLGFFGPMILNPDANQGPLLGIFITGPAGFLLGGVIGIIFAVKNQNKED